MIVIGIITLLDIWIILPFTTHIKFIIKVLNLGRRPARSSWFSAPSSSFLTIIWSFVEGPHEPLSWPNYHFLQPSVSGRAVEESRQARKRYPYPYPEPNYGIILFARGYIIPSCLGGVYQPAAAFVRMNHSIFMVLMTFHGFLYGALAWSLSHLPRPDIVKPSWHHHGEEDF